jgi:hypothetical protein
VFLLFMKAGETKKATAIPRSAQIGYDPTGWFGKPLSSEASTGENDRRPTVVVHPRYVPVSPYAPYYYYSRWKSLLAVLDLRPFERRQAVVPLAK